jgi:hypothetical protein
MSMKNSNDTIGKFPLRFQQAIRESAVLVADICKVKRGGFHRVYLTTGVPPYPLIQ